MVLLRLGLSRTGVVASIKRHCGTYIRQMDMQTKEVYATKIFLEAVD